MSKILCIYHGHCDDGFAAAWCVRKALGETNVEFYPGVYQQVPPPTQGRDVVFVDFSYKRPVLDAMAKAANSILILDHHKTAQEDLADLPVAPLTNFNWMRVRDTMPMAVLFDMERSGAALAWDFFCENVPVDHGAARPTFIEYIQDRDLWRKQLHGGDEFTIALRSYPQDFETWDELVKQGAFSLIAEGKGIQRYYRLRVEELKRSAYRATLGGHYCMISNAPYFAASEVAGELADENAATADFGACYFEASKGRYQYSLRSRGEFDVSAIARQFGGGGHRNAAGFSVDVPAHIT